MSSRTVVIPLVGFHTTDMLEPLVFQHMPVTAKIGDIRSKILETCKHVDSHTLRICLKGKYSATGVEDKLEDKMTLKQVLQTLVKGYARELKALTEEQAKIQQIQKEAKSDQDNLQEDLEKYAQECEALKINYEKKERTTKNLLSKSMKSPTKESKTAIAKLREERRVDQDRTKEVEEKYAVLKRKVAAANGRCSRLQTEVKRIASEISASKKRSADFEKGDKLNLVGIKIEGGQSAADQQVKMLDIMVSQVRKRRADAGNRIDFLGEELERINGMISELEKKQSKIKYERDKRKEEMAHLTNNVQASSVRKFEQLIALSKNTVRKSNATKSTIDKTLARTRLLLARGYSNTSHRKDPSRRKVLRNTGKSISRQ
mmetsp:Transcript_11055/g.17977  ORF Transcript_11055/g.17977 Transcript_11055/m.17977 type:complete len:374 (-) Transcript_11055:58-1179(-)